MKIKLKNVRINWSQRLFVAQDYNGDEKFKYSAEFIMDEDSEALALVNDTIDEVGKEEFKKTWDKVKKKLIGGKSYCLKDGEDNVDKEGNQRKGYEDTYYFKAANSKKPFVLDRGKRHVSEDDDLIYDGCYVNAVVDIWPQNNKYGAGINAKLLGVQFFSDGESMSFGETASLDDFDEYEQEDEMGEEAEGEELL